MRPSRFALLAPLLAAAACARPGTTPATVPATAPAAAAASATTPGAAPLVIGETFTMPSRALGETRRLNVWAPPEYRGDVRLPVLYMPDGGMAEDFLHVAGLLQVSIGNGTMRPMLLVGIENTQRRRDMTGPTTVDADRKIAPKVGGSAEFRAFIRDELMPEVRRRYRTTGESGIVGESLAGLFVVETFLREPALFDHYIAIDPSVWWNDEGLVRDSPTLLRARPAAPQQLWIATSSDAGIAPPVGRLVSALEGLDPAGLKWHHVPMPEEKHATIYHPAALRAFRTLFAPVPAPAK